MPRRRRTHLVDESEAMSQLDDRPLLTTAVRAAVAVMISWWLVLLMPSPLSDYPYYAPLGAVIAVGTNPGGSLRTGLQAVAAIALGGSIAVGASFLTKDPDDLLVVGGAILVAMVLSGWKLLGDMGLWVATSATFCLLIGQGDPGWVLAYGAIVLLGALTAVVVTFLAPGQPMVRLGHDLDRVRDALAARVEDCIRVLEDEHQPLTDQDRGVEASLDRARATMREVTESRRGNPRVHRRTTDVDLAREQLEAWHQISGMLGAVIDLGTSPQTRTTLLSKEVREPTTEVLRALVPLLRDTRARASADQIGTVRGRLDELETLLDQHRIPHSPAATLVTVSIRRSLDILEPTAR